MYYWWSAAVLCTSALLFCIRASRCSLALSLVPGFVLPFTRGARWLIGVAAAGLGVVDLASPKTQLMLSSCSAHAQLVPESDSRRGGFGSLVAPGTTSANCSPPICRLAASELACSCCFSSRRLEASGAGSSRSIGGPGRFAAVTGYL